MNVMILFFKFISKLNEEYKSIQATVDETLDQNQLNLAFNIIETEKFFIERTKAFISAGGSTFQSEISGANTKYIALQSKLKRKDKFNIGAIGVSIGPFENIKKELSVIEYLKRLDFLALRDTRSFEFVKSLSLDYEPIKAFDLAALLPSIYEVVINSLLYWLILVNL